MLAILSLFWNAKYSRNWWCCWSKFEELKWVFMEQMKSKLREVFKDEIWQIIKEELKEKPSSPSVYFRSTWIHWESERDRESNVVLQEYSRITCLRITNIPFEKNEASKKVLEKVKKLINEVGVDIPGSNIDKAHLTGSKKEKKHVGNIRNI